MLWVPALFLVFLAPVMQVSSNMEEDKLSVMRATGSSVVMDCDLTGSYIHWYKFQDGAVPRRLLHYIVSNSKVVLDSGISEGKYHVYKGTGKSYTFVISNLQESDSGTYYCAVWE
uniref:Ig-like domain-containing protein n=1 Tax=Bos taurus TaxID=9913 RepID=A0AAA9SL71_BOVIN